MVGLNGLLCFAVVGSLLFASHLVAVQRNLVSSMFGDGIETPAHDGRYNILLLGGDSGSDRVGLRPASTRDGLPLIGHVPGKGNVFLATGHGPYGLHLGPYSAKLVADWMGGRQAEPDGHLFRAGRFLSG